MPMTAYVPPTSATVELRKDDRWIKLSLRFGGNPLHGPLVSLAEVAVVAIEPANEMAESYTIKNWMSGIISGARYTSRKLQIEDRRFVLEHLEGKLGSDDMTAVADAAARAVSVLAEKECPAINLEGWTAEAK
jgi:hypothetical protein